MSSSFFLLYLVSFLWTIMPVRSTRYTYKSGLTAWGPPSRTGATGSAGSQDNPSRGPRESFDNGGRGARRPEARAPFQGRLEAHRPDLRPRREQWDVSENETEPGVARDRVGRTVSRDLTVPRVGQRGERDRQALQAVRYEERVHGAAGDRTGLPGPLRRGDGSTAYPRAGAARLRAEVVVVRVSGDAGSGVSGCLLSVASMDAMLKYLNDREEAEAKSQDSDSPGALANRPPASP
jgi:hypothetical protein